MVEPSTDILLTNASVYEKYVKIITAPEAAFRKAEDKQQTMMTCMDEGIPCPITKRDNETYEEYIAKVGYPIAVKPRKGTGSIGFHCVENEQQMNALRKLGFKDEENVIQEYIPQTDTQYIGFFMLGDNYELKTAVICDKYRWYPIDGGSASYIQTIDRPDLVENGYKLLKAIGWKGEAHLDFIGDPREGGLPKIMEINGRIPASIKMCWVVGIPIVKQELQYAFGKPIDTCLNKVPEGLGLRYFQTDFLWLLKSPNRFKAKPSWFNFSKSKDFIWSIKDPLPFFSYSLSHVLTLKSDMKKRKR
jgi:carbamoylphosphate synthase large subunit